MNETAATEHARFCASGVHLAAADGAAVAERVGPFEIRLAGDGVEVARAQDLRYRVFFEEGGAVADELAQRMRRDLCAFDAICDHLVVVDVEGWRSMEGGVVGTYRLLRRAVAERHGGFYSQREFDLAPLLAAHPGARFLELGRSCVRRDYRSKRVIELLWRGLRRYAQHHAIDALFGCASLPGVDLEANRLGLDYLHHHAPAEANWRVAPLPDRAAAFNPGAREATDARRGFLSLPPLIKAYARAGARFSDGVVLDHAFGTTDLFAVMPMADIEARYLAHFGQPSCLSDVSAA